MAAGPGSTSGFYAPGFKEENFPSLLGARGIFLNFRDPFSGAGIFLFPGGRMRAPGSRMRSELRRASRAGAEKSIRDAGALRAPAPTKDFFDFCNDFLVFGVSNFGNFLTDFCDFRV